ncbi:hypothetical protein LTR62_002266 [Meristemomyces frigidus]|uniref:Methyltransferase domain-containing protein n=1 Tax=Meristemomyces frigidus TaxID=1508187 RepID=A0AAN7YHN5_9PEZI|nr:hypothetical protein LTR62_002266 [Meristemomyces frigidus]
MTNFTEANRKAFDNLASEYNTKPWQQALSAQVTNELQHRETWIGAQWTTTTSQTPTTNAKAEDLECKLLDYACGTGVVTKALGPRVNTIRGIDISEKMVEKYNEACRSSGLDEEKAHAVVGDILTSPPSAELQGKEWYDFGVAVICLGFHHFEFPQLAVTRLVERLRKGGVLFIVDFLPFDDEVEKEKRMREERGGGGDFPDMTHTIRHNGFNESQMETFFEDAGLGDFGFNLATNTTTMELKGGTMERQIFFAKGRKV